MTPAHALALVAVGLVAGTVNTIVGSGSLITFPTLLALGYPAVLANVTNTVGLLPGSVAGAVGYRRELAGQRRRLLILGTIGAAGGLIGGLLLLYVARAQFRQVVPYLILLACLLVAVQPRLGPWLTARSRSAHGGPLLYAAVFLTAVYGGYFGAAQSVILLALLAMLVADDLQRLNAAKNVLAAVINAVAVLLFVVATHIAWGAAALLAAGSVVGGRFGAGAGRRLPDNALRAAIIVVGVSVSIALLL